MDELVAGYNELAAERQRLSETFKDFPEDAAKAGEFYKLPEEMLPEGVTLPEGAKFEANTALLERAVPVLHKHRIAPDAFHDLVRAFNAHEVEAYQKANDEFAEDAKTLGANGPARRKAINDGLAALVGPELAKTIDANALMSGGVALFEAIIKKFSSSNVVPLDTKRDDHPAPEKKPLAERMFPLRQLSEKAG